MWKPGQQPELRVPVPGGLFQVLITDPAGEAPDFSSKLDDHIASFRETYPGSAYRLFDGPAVRRIIAQSFGERVTRAYDRLVPLAFKADLARYCLLFEFGGLYSDLSHRHLSPIDLSADPGMVVFRDLPMHPPWAVSNGLIYARPGRKELARAIRLVTRHADVCYYGASPLDPTGPYLFGRALAQSADWRDVVFGGSRPARPRWPFRSRTGPRAVKTMPDGRVVALKEKTAHASIADLVGAGGNDYNRIWLRRQVWGEEAIVVQARDPLVSSGVGVERTQDGLHILPGHSGIRVSGPRWPLKAGPCMVGVAFDPDGFRGKYRIEVVVGDGANVVFRGTGGSPADTGLAKFRFDLSHDVEDFQIRIVSDADFAATLSRIEVTEVEQ